MFSSQPPGRISGNHTTTLSIGYPIAIFLLIALPSSAYARDAFCVIALLYIWRDRAHGKEAIVKLVKNTTVLSGIILISYVCLSSLWSQEPHIRSPEEQFRNGISTCLFWLGSCLYFYNDKNAQKRLFWAIGIGLVANLIGTWLTKGNLFPSNRLTGYGILINPILLGSVAVIQVAIGMHLRPSGRLEAAATTTMLGLCIAAVSLSVSRGPLVALAAVLIVWLIYSPALKQQHKAYLAVISIFSATVLAFTTNFVELITHRGTSYRLDIWKESIKYGQQNLILGWGWINDFKASVAKYELYDQTRILMHHPHNLLVSAFYYGGLIGLLTHMAFLTLNAREALRSNQRSLSFSLTVAILLLTSTDTHAAIAKRDFMLLIFWLPSALIIVTSLPLNAKRA